MQPILTQLPEYRQPSFDTLSSHENSPQSSRFCAEFKSWPQESEQRDKWSFCLTAGKIDPRIRRDDEQTSTPEPHTGFHGEGGASRHQGRDDAVRTGTAV